MIRREYKILPVDENGYRHDPERDDSSRSCLLNCLLLMTTVFIVSGIAAICITLLWPKEFHTVVDNYWSTHPFYFHYHWPANITNSSDESYLTIVTENSSGVHNHNQSMDFNSNWTSTSSAEDLGKNNTAIIEDKKDHTNHFNSSSEEIIDESNVGKKFAETMRNFEKEMEKLSGIHQAELVIPLFMLVTLMSTLALISLCCCLMSKRRESKQRKLLGKIITDLQTGERSREVLLGKDDGDF